MIYDSLGSLPIPQSLDIKLEKNLKAEEPRAIEESEKGNDSSLDSNKQNIASSQASKDIIKNGDIEFETYNTQGNLVEKLSSDDDMNHNHESINFVI